jgi:hypothetical protein
LSPIRLLGSVLGILAGMAAGLVNEVARASTTIGSAPGSEVTVLRPDLGGALLIAGAILGLISLVSLTGFRIMFVLGAAASLGVLGVLALTWGDFGASDAVAVAVICVLAFLADVVASMSSGALSEKDSPLNLPVFG